MVISLISPEYSYKYFTWDQYASAIGGLCYTTAPTIALFINPISLTNDGYLELTPSAAFALDSTLSNLNSKIVTVNTGAVVISSGTITVSNAFDLDGNTSKTYNYSRHYLGANTQVLNGGSNTLVIKCTTYTTGQISPLSITLMDMKRVATSNFYLLINSNNIKWKIYYSGGIS